MWLTSWAEVGDQLSRIHKRVLVGSDSSAFTSMFSGEGQTDEMPVVLQEENLEQFEALMRILYPLWVHVMLVMVHRLNKHRLLEDVLHIPVTTYILAMRMATKYSMDDVQGAITKVIQSISPPRLTFGIDKAIERLAFIAEFPSHFSRDDAVHAFIRACPTSVYPTTHDLKPLRNHLDFVVLMMQYREGLRNPSQAQWMLMGVITRDVMAWLNSEFEALGFKP